MVIRHERDRGEPLPKVWTRDEYYQLAGMGLFRNARVELIDGEIVEMTPQRAQHAVAIGLVERALREVFGAAYWIRVQMPLSVSPQSEPEPDLAVVPGTPRDYADHPGSALLVVEVSDTTLEHDSARKASLYASAGISDYWVVDLTVGAVVAFRDPVAARGATFGFSYASVTRFASDQQISPLASEHGAIRVADLLP